MLIYAIDDEPIVLENLHEAIAGAVPDAQIRDFRRAGDALEAVKTGEKPDVVFTDIQMPDMNGLQLAAQLKASAPDVRIVFVTAYSEYALEAWKQHVNGYLMKPVTAEDIRETLASLPMPLKPPLDKLFVRCFGDFAVFWKGDPLLFERRKTKELFAVLIDKHGAVCTAEEAAAALWEDETDMAAAKTRLRAILSDMRRTLEAIGMADIIVRKRGVVSLRIDKIDCDYYRMLEGDVSAINSYRGEYMRQYSWAEMTAASLYFGNKV